MGRQGKQIWGLALSVMGILGVCLACGLPMWRETHFAGANILSAQSVFDGLWWNCNMQATGHMLCKSHTTSMTPDIKAGRSLTVISILSGLLGFIVSLVGGGVAKCRRSPPDSLGPPSASSTSMRARMLGGSLSGLSGILCLVSVSLSAATTISNSRDPCVVAAQKREVGSAIYIGCASSLLLLLSGALTCFFCGEKESPQSSNRSNMPYRSNTQFNNYSSNMTTLRSDVMRSNSSRMFDRYAPNRRVENLSQVHKPLNEAQSGAAV